MQGTRAFLFAGIGGQILLRTTIPPGAIIGADLQPIFSFGFPSSSPRDCLLSPSCGDWLKGPGTQMLPNHTIQRMRASRSRESEFQHPRRLARTADGGRSASTWHGFEDRTCVCKAYRPSSPSSWAACAGGASFRGNSANESMAHEWNFIVCFDKW